MRLTVTGGGTGGHVFPALETAKAARELGWQVEYLGSVRGQELAACAKAGMPFVGFPSQPLVKPLSIQGAKTLVLMVKAIQMAVRRLSESRPDVVLTMGGYSSAPVITAAKRLKIPLVVHEQNSVPGRTNLLAAKKAIKVCTVFKAASRHFDAGKTVRTGTPIRARLREASYGTLPFNSPWASGRPAVLVMGGSQGAAALNDVSLATAVRMARAGIQWIHLTGEKNYESALEARAKLSVGEDYDIKAFMDEEGMAEAFSACHMAICRSGAGTLTELAAFRRPSILVPYPRAFADHQRVNAQEFVDIGAAIMVDQKDLDPAGLEGRVLSWLHDKDLYQAAQLAMAEWDVEDSVEKIIKAINEAAAKSAFVGK